MLGQRLVRFKLRLKELGVLLHQVGALFVQAFETVGVVPEVVEEQRNRPVALGLELFLPLLIVGIWINL